ncbi:MAG: type 1 glutamine amidotransferase, partial [Acidimicrobiia bacterium]|nr:type 1 glutamine amidotransferase [Acidimicrobiia bacterium]
IQNHPEFAPGYFEDLLDRRGDGLPHDVLVDARERNHRSPHDAAAVSEWVKAFFDRGRTPDA